MNIQLTEEEKAVVLRALILFEEQTKNGIRCSLDAADPEAGRRTMKSDVSDWVLMESVRGKISQ